LVIDVRVNVTRNDVARMRDVDWRQAHARMGSYLTREITRMFETEGSSRGHPWEPLSAGYEDLKESVGRSTKILTLSGTLRNSFRALEVSDERLVFGSDLERARTHHEGERFPGGKLVTLSGPQGEGSIRISGVPQRTLLTTTGQDKQQYQDAIESTLTDHAREVGR